MGRKEGKPSKKEPPSPEPSGFVHSPIMLFAFCSNIELYPGPVLSINAVLYKTGQLKKHTCAGPSSVNK